MKKEPAISAAERQYRAEDDARVLKRHAELTGDKSRMRAAQSFLKKELTQTQRALGAGKATTSTVKRRKK